MENVINKIFPSKCIACDEIGEAFCDNCVSTCRLLENQRCVVCDKPSPKGKTHINCFSISTPTQTISIYRYETLVRDCIRKAKYQRKEFMALKKLSYEAAVLANEAGYSFENFITVPVPSSKDRLNQRGFNQAKVIADKFSYILKLKTDMSILIRHKSTGSQHKYDKKTRFENVRDVFKVGTKAKDKKILLIDDICTTGATLLETSRALYKEGAKEVKCFTLSKKLL